MCSLHYCNIALTPSRVVMTSNNTPKSGWGERRGQRPVAVAGGDAAQLVLVAAHTKGGFGVDGV
jgi:hypothetical protein